VALGFTDELISLDEETRERLGITSDFSDVHTSLGPGAMRALVAYVN